MFILCFGYTCTYQLTVVFDVVWIQGRKVTNKNKNSNCIYEGDNATLKVWRHRNYNAGHKTLWHLSKEQTRRCIFLPKNTIIFSPFDVLLSPQPSPRKCRNVWAVHRVILLSKTIKSPYCKLKEGKSRIFTAVCTSSISNTIIMSNLCSETKLV